MKQRKIFLLIACCILTGCGAFYPGTVQKSTGKEPVIFIAAEWNIQALFDGQEAGNEYSEYRESAGWTIEKYQARLAAISRAIPLMIEDDSGEKNHNGIKPENSARVPDLIGLVELENSAILAGLAEGPLSGHGYYWTAYGNLPGSPLGIGFLSRFPLKDVRLHSITIGDETAPRPVLEVRVEPREQPLVFLLCHWKSKLGDENTAKALRRASARVIQRRLRELRDAEPETPVIIMGDLNENYDEFYRHSGDVEASASAKTPGNASAKAPGSAPGKLLSALLPDDAAAAALVSVYGNDREFLVLSGDKPPRTSFFPKDVPALFSPWYDDLTDGSYFFRDEWETIDHFLLSDGLFDRKGWEYSRCLVLNNAPFTTPEGIPNAYVPRTGRGLSDHLPLLLYLEYRE